MGWLRVSTRAERPSMSDRRMNSCLRSADRRRFGAAELCSRAATHLISEQICPVAVKNWMAALYGEKEATPVNFCPSQADPSRPPWFRRKRDSHPFLSGESNFTSKVVNVRDELLHDKLEAVAGAPAN